MRDLDISRLFNFLKEAIKSLDKINNRLEAIEQLLTPDEPPEEEVRRYLNSESDYGDIPHWKDNQ